MRLGRKSLKKVAVISVYVVVCCVAVALASEGLLRLAMPSLPEPLRIQIDAGQYGFAKNDIKMDDLYLGEIYKSGFSIDYKNVEFSYHEEDGNLGFDGIGFVDDGVDGKVYGVLVGDSMSEGIGVPLEKKWIEIIEQESGRDFVNLGVAGYSVTQSARMFEKYGSAFEPSVVLIQVNPTDFRDETKFKKWVDSGQKFGYREFETADKPLFELRKFVAKNFLIHRLYRVSSLASTNQLMVYKSDTLNLQLDRLQDYPDRASIDGAPILESSLVSLDRDVRESGARLIVVYVPFREQTYTHLIPNATDEKAMWSRDRLIEICDRNGLECIDPTDEFRRNADRQLYFAFDAHFNEDGYRILADFVSDYMKKDGLL